MRAEDGAAVTRAVAAGAPSSAAPGGAGRPLRYADLVMTSARRRLALVALLLLTLGGTATVATRHPASFGGSRASAARFLGPDATANGLVVGSAPKGADRSGTTRSSKRHAHSALLAVLVGTLGALALLGRRLRPEHGTASPLVHQLPQLSRAPPRLA